MPMTSAVRDRTAGGYHGTQLHLSSLLTFLPDAVILVEAMTMFTDDALVLRTSAYRDRDQIVSVLTPSHGVVRGVLRNARGGKRPTAAATQVLSHISCNVYRAPNAELANFREVRLNRSSFDLSRDLVAASASAVVAELLQSFFPEYEPAPRPFRLGLAALEALLNDESPSLVVAYVQFWTLALSGLLPPLDSCAQCSRALEEGFAPRIEDGQPICHRCLPNSPRWLGYQDLEFLRCCRENSIDSTPTPSPGARAWLANLVRHEAEKPLKALSFFEDQLK